MEGGGESDNGKTNDGARCFEDLTPPLLKYARGIVLDIGPGSGGHLPLLAKNADQMTQIYGAEPCVGLHKTLEKNVAAAGLEDKYIIMGCSAEYDSLKLALEKQAKKQDLTETTMSEAVFDTIICCRVLCSIPEPRNTCDGLYKMLKPGGTMLVCEHVVNPWRTTKGSVVARILQSIYSLCGWSFFISNCRLRQDTKKLLLESAASDGGWEKVSLDDDFLWSPLPYLSGTLVKKE